MWNTLISEQLVPAIGEHVPKLIRLHSVQVKNLIYELFNL